MLNGKKTRAKKNYCVIAYDIAEHKRRNHVIKLVEPYGRRINYSVFECMFTTNQLARLQQRLEQVIIKGQDQIAIYPICVACYTRICYIPAQNPGFQTVHIFE